MKKLLLSLMSIALIACQGEDALEAPTQEADGNFGTRGNLTALCHWDAVNQQFIVISVNANALPAHLNHGDQLVDADGDGYTAIGSCTGSMDDCDDFDPAVNPEQGCSAILAVAYSDLNGEDGYQEGSSDVLISKLIDFNNDGVVSVGDKVITHQYPTNFIPDSFDDFTVTEHVINGVIGFANHFVAVSIDEINIFHWYHTADIQESYIEFIQFTGINSSIIDTLGNEYNDGILIESNSPSAPNQSIYSYQPANGNHTFIDVDIFVSQ